MNRRRIYYLCSLLVTFLFLGCQEKDTFEWSAGLSGPRHYGSSGPFVEFFYQGKSVGGASIGTGADLGWTITSSSYSGGKKFKPVPDSIFVNWVCASDRYEYEGGYKLPREKMIALFKKDVMDPFGLVRYGKITTGMAPGGNVTVWLQGGQASTEICKFKVVNKGVWKENDPDYNKYIKKHREVSEGFKESNIFHYLYGIPYDTWETGEKKYEYDIVFSSEDENRNDYSIAILGITKDGSVIYSNKRPIPHVKWNENIDYIVKKDKKLPVQFWIRWHSQDGLEWYETLVTLPNNLETQLLQFEKKYGKNVVLIVGMDKVSENEAYTFGRLWFGNSKGKIEIMKFRAAKFNLEKKEYPVSKYSLPKGFVFPKWEGREALIKPTDFEYWQEK
ncbi:DUF2931 family protein [Flavobacterium hercynium]|uniref:DUF2931 domain-containing protein n=1 Tax=Flavobacterium hercynium TaxID=387094 RepID=A0A226GM44_9FLAO|nr:DUF2931 family protein [Flavobacterium hercynium]OXA83093.1 hypothetical protein B0A66_22575 [Flavobacterium hercynium]